MHWLWREQPVEEECPDIDDMIFGDAQPHSEK